MDEKRVSLLLSIVTVLVSLTWAVLFLASVFVSGYEPPNEVNIVMMAIVGLFVQLLLKSKNPKEEEDK